MPIQLTNSHSALAQHPHVENGLELSAPQHIFLNELNTKFRAYVGGYGSGKSYVGCLDLLLFAIKHPDTVQGYFGPTYGSITTIFYPTLEEAAESLGIDVVIKRADKEVHLFVNGSPIGVIICRSMDNPSSIVGFKISRALVDEIDTLPTDRSDQSWKKIIARMRLIIPGEVNSIGVTCTPEGFLFVYRHFKKDPSADYSMVQASTYENQKFLPPDYIQSLYDTYPSQLVDAYIMGEFVNLNSASVYPSFDRISNNQVWTEQPMMIHMGCDFNVTNTSAVLAQMVNGKIHVFKEYHGVYDTPALVELIKEDYGDNRPLIHCYPDASGKNRHTANASTSDHAVIKEVATLRVAKSNPAIKDRYMSVNKALEDGKLTIDVDKCPELVQCLEQQTFDEKTLLPDKEAGLDHLLDALGYMVYYHFKIVKPSFKMGYAA